jgi:hypothetical protein
MSNELALILQNNPALVQTGLDADTLAVAGGGGQDVNKRISIKGGVFRKMAGGKEVASIEDRHMNVIIVKMAHTASRTYYASSYKEGEKIVPSCWSSDSRGPDAKVATPMARSCAECPMSIKNSAAGGGSSACRLSWRIAVALPNDPNQDVLQLILPSTSCWQKEDSGKWGFRPYIQMLANNNVSASRLITKMQFDTKSPTPKILFSPAGAVPPADIPLMEQLGASQAAENAVKFEVYIPKESIEVPAGLQPTLHVEVPEAAPAPVKEAAPVEAASVDVAPESDVAEPVLRESTAPKAPEVKDVGSIINKWSVKS